MFIKQFSTRFFHINRCVYSASNKSSLATLRKKTGYTFANCKKALELHSNDVEKAEEWLKQEAQKLGWSKATKLEGRPTGQGLIGVLIKHNIGTIVEVNCETDFVARNSIFQKFVNTVSEACIERVKDMPSNGPLAKIDFSGDILKSLPNPADGCTLADSVAMLIGTVGENATVKRATCFKTENSILLSGYTHPPVDNRSVDQNTCQLGKYGTIVAFKSSEPMISIENQKNICQHIVGMNPERLGDKEKDEPCADKDDEKCLIYQEYLVDTSVTVDEFLHEQKVQIIDFQRYECGEALSKNHIEDINVGKAIQN